MTVEVSIPNLVEDLMESLQSTGCIVVRRDAKRLEIRFGWPLRDHASQYELDGYLRAWEAKHRGVRATRVG